MVPTVMGNKITYNYACFCKKKQKIKSMERRAIMHLNADACSEGKLVCRTHGFNSGLTTER